MNVAQKINTARTFRGYKVQFGKQQPALSGRMEDERFAIAADDVARHVARNTVVIHGQRIVVTMV